ncbi:FRG domain-containing protein [Vibrio fluvialis]|nr:FRG domain-containing protein [Vibrio fluvialis]
MEKYTFSSLSEYLEITRKLPMIFNCHASDLWYRGIKDESMELIPGICWRNISSNREESLVAEFMTYYQNYSKCKPNNALELLALMQHYGLPTRLLDWSLSPLVSLYFALEQDNNNANRVVWVIRPHLLNELSLGFKGVVVPNDFRQTMINDYLPRYMRSNNADVPDMPIALSLPLVNQRMTSQKGAFTLHGFNRNPVDKYISESGELGCIKMELKSEEFRQSILQELYSSGLKEDDVYQDLNSLSTRIMREYGI